MSAAASWGEAAASLHHAPRANDSRAAHDPTGAAAAAGRAPVRKELLPPRRRDQCRGTTFLPLYFSTQMGMSCLLEHYRSELIVFCVAVQAMERYRALIKRPIDLGTVYVKLRQSAYPDLARFEKDVERVFNNCERFNSTAPANHVIVAHAKHLRDLFRGLFSEMVSSGGMGRGRLGIYLDAPVLLRQASPRLAC